MVLHRESSARNVRAATPFKSLHMSTSEPTLGELAELQAGEFETLEEQSPFRCSYCVRLILEDQPVYMRNDCTFCTEGCRHKGPSALYANLREMGMERGSHLTRTVSESNATSLFSETAADSASIFESDDEEDEPDEEEAQGPLRWILKTVISTLVSSFPTRKTFRSESAFMLDKLAHGSAMELALDYVPKVTSFASSLYEGGFSRSASLCSLVHPW